MKKVNSNKGITLIALIITIIVLLILAGIVLAMVVGDNGILSKAQTAKERTDKTQSEELDQLSNFEDKINNYMENRNGKPVYLDESEHEIGKLGNKKLYQKTFLDREITITTTNRTWYTVINNDELSNLNIDMCFLDEGNSYTKLIYTKGTYEGDQTYYALNHFNNSGEYCQTTFNRDQNGILGIKQCRAGLPISNDDVNGIRYYTTITIKYTKTTD